MVVEQVTRLSKRRTQTSSEAFPDDALETTRSAVEAVTASVFEDAAKHKESGVFDDDIDTDVDRHGIAGLATVLTYAVARERVEVTYRLI